MTPTSHVRILCFEHSELTPSCTTIVAMVYCRHSGSLPTYIAYLIEICLFSFESFFTSFHLFSCTNIDYSKAGLFLSDFSFSFVLIIPLYLIILLDISIIIFLSTSLTLFSDNILFLSSVPK